MGLLLLDLLVDLLLMSQNELVTDPFGPRLSLLPERLVVHLHLSHLLIELVRLLEVHLDVVQLPRLPRDKCALGLGLGLLHIWVVVAGAEVVQRELLHLGLELLQHQLGLVVPPFLAVFSLYHV